MKNVKRPADMEAREEILAERKRNVFVQASAGTGKTTLIVDRVYRLVQGGIPLERLVVVTFTKAAAAELRSRIRERLLDGRAKGEDLCARALSVLPGAWISTIHGFAARVLREFFNFTCVDPAFSITDGHYSQEEIRRTWDAWLLGLDGSGPLCCTEALSRMGTDLQREIALGIERRRWLDSIVMIGDSSTAASILQEYISEHVPIVENLLGGCSDPSDRLYQDGIAFLEGLGNLRSDIADDDYRKVAKLSAMINLQHGSGKNWDDLSRAKALMKTAREEFRLIAPVVKSGRLTEQTWEFAGTFATLLRTQWDSDRSRMSYDDLLFVAWKAVAENRNLSKCLSDKFDHFLIDEFQDTSLDQVNLFNSFLEEAGRLPSGRVTVVADDKQSIYGWRNADIETFREFRTKLENGGACSRTVTTNFRSSTSIIRFVNGFCSSLFKDQGPEEEKFGCLYSEIVPRPGAPMGEKVRVVSIPKFKDRPVSGEGRPGHAAMLQARWFADYVREGTEKGHSPGDYALLVRSTTHLHHFVNELESNDIPYFVDATRDFRKRQEIADLRELLRCLLHPDDTLAWVHVLRSLFFGISDPVIHEAISCGTSGFMKEGSECPAVVLGAHEELRKFRRSLLRLPLADFLYELYFQAELIPSIAAAGHQEIRRLGNLQYILDLVLSGFVSSPELLLEMLDEDLSPVLTEEPSTVPAEGGAVTITTIHRAKGLAWKHVVIAAPSVRAGGGRARSVISYDHESRAAFNLGVSFNGDSFKLKTPYWHDISRKNSAREKAEFRRLLYVAVTRPMTSLVIFAHVLDEPDKGSPASILWFNLQSASEKDPGLFNCEELDDLQGETGAEDIAVTGTGEKTPKSSLPVLFEALMEPLNWKSRGMVIGDLVHGVMEKIDFRRPKDWFTENEPYLQAVFGEDFEEVRELSLRFFHMDLPFDVRKVTVIGREYQYFRTVSGRLQNRYVDLLLKVDDELVVIDYKTDSFGGRTVEQAALEYVQKQQQYILDISSCFGMRTAGYLVFLREGALYRVP